MRYIILLLCLTSCGPVCSKDPGLYSLLTQFVQEFDIDPNNVCDMHYGSLEPDVQLGVAETAPLYRCDITIVPNQLPRTNRAVVYHEILHCVGYEHVDNPDSLMYYQAKDEHYYKVHWAELMEGVHEVLLVR